MLVSLFAWLQTLSPELGFLRVFQYLTFRAVMAAMTALLIGLIAGPWVIRRLAELKRPTVLVTHKAVSRAIYALASGWPMIGKPPVKLRPNCAHLYALAADGTPAIERLNVSLEG